MNEEELVLTIRIAEQFIADQGGVSLNSYAAIDDAAAAILAKYEGFDLYLNGLASLSDATASSLAKYEGNLELFGLTSLSDAAAASFAKHQGSLCLSGLTSLSDAAAESLGKFQGSLSLSGLTSLSDAAAESLANHEGTLELDGLTALSDEAAQSLARHKGCLSLLGLDSLSSAAGDALRGLIHPVVSCTSVPLSHVKLPRSVDSDDATASRLLQVSAIQCLINDIEQAGYISGCTHEDETGGRLDFALLKFAYRYEAGQNGGLISKELANAMTADIHRHGLPEEEMRELLDSGFDCDEDARLILAALLGDEDTAEDTDDYDNA